MNEIIKIYKIINKMSKTTFVTGVSITNAMVVTTLVVLPLNFHRAGIIENSIATVSYGIFRY